MTRPSHFSAALRNDGRVRQRRDTEPTQRIPTLSDQELADESHERLAVTAPVGGGR